MVQVHLRDLARLTRAGREAHNRQHVAVTTRAPQAALDKALKKAGVPLPKQAGD